MEQQAIIAKIETIASIEAVTLKNGHQYRIDAVFADGSRETLKAKSNKKPEMVQAFSFRANGNFRGEGIGAYFTFAKNVSSDCRDAHIKGFIVS